MANFDYIKKRLAQLESHRGTWEEHWQDILDYVMQRKAEVVSKREKGEKKNRSII